MSGPGALRHRGHAVGERGGRKSLPQQAKGLGIRARVGDIEKLSHELGDRHGIAPARRERSCLGRLDFDIPFRGAR